MSLKKCMQRHRQDGAERGEVGVRIRLVASSGDSGTKNFVLSLDKNME